MIDSHSSGGFSGGLRTPQRQGGPAVATGWVLLALLILGGGLSPVSGQPYGLTQRPAVGPFLNNALPRSVENSAQGWSVVSAFPNLTFDDPVALVAEPHTNRLYVAGRQGTIHFFTNNPATTNKTLFLDLTPVTQGYDDCGLIGFAFHPEYGIPSSTNRGFVYVYYQFSPSPTSGPNRPAAATPGYNRLSRFTVPDGSLVANRNSELILINQYDRHVWHNGGGMFFGPDGFLYLSNGDEGAANDSYNQTQKINSGLFSGVLRIDVDQDLSRSHPIRRQPLPPATPPAGWPATFTAHYSIPNDNPWLDPGGSLLEEFYCIGLRSPHRMTRDPVTGRIWLGDVGQGSWEEVDLIEKGGNYQWAYREGANTGPKSKPSPLIGVDKPPIHNYAHSSGNNCVIGGYVYRGAQHPSLFGKYLFGDNGSGRIWTLDYDGTNAATVTYLVNMPAGVNYTGLSSFGVDNDNELYMLKMGRPSSIYKLARTGTPPPAPPALLSQTGAFTNLANLSAAPGLVPFTVNAPLWSDAAAKARWMAVPTNATIGFFTNGSWSWPTGTVLVKHFDLPVNETNAAALKRLETRFLVRATNGGWFGLTYKWRPDHSEADLLASSLEEPVTIITPTGVRTQIWYYPSRQDCLVCHNDNAGNVLGPRTCQLNGNFTYPQTGVTDNQLRALNQVGLFSPALNAAAIPSLPKSAALTDTSVSLETRVRSYLDANCAHCHRPNGVSGLFDARLQTPLGSQGLVGGEVVNPMGVAGAKIVAAGSVSQSLLHVRDSLVGPGQMPPLARNVPDAAYLDLLAQWINSLTAPGDLPPPWAHQDVGPVGVAGSVTHVSGTFNLVASGVDIWDQEDSFHFVYQPLAGDAILTARVVAVANTDPWAIAGVMIRQNLTGGSPHALAAMTRQHGFSYTRRLQQAAASLYTAGTSSAVPYWVRLVRASNTFSAFQSADGTSWSLVGSNTIAMSGTVYAGLAWASHNNSTLGTASFDNVSIVNPATNQPPTLSPIADVTVDEDTVAGPISFSIGDVETPAANLLLSKTSSAPALVPTANIVFGGAGSNRTMTITPATNAHGTAIITVAVSDGTNSAAWPFQLTVLPVNDAPVAVADLLTRPMSQGVSTSVGHLLANDEDVENDTITLLSVFAANPIGAALTHSNNAVTYWPLFGDTNAGSFNYAVTDGSGGFATGLVTVAVQPDPAGVDVLYLTATNGAALNVGLTGIPGFTYTVQYATELSPPDWKNLTIATADNLGHIDIMDTIMGGTNRFYRAVRGIAP